MQNIIQEVESLMKKWILAALIAAAAELSAGYQPALFDLCCFEGGLQGFYAGIHGGAISHTAYRNDVDGVLQGNPTGWSVVDTNVSAGAQVGYDFRCQAMLLGGVVDGSWTNIDKTIEIEPNTTGGDQIANKVPWYGTIRAKLGLAVCDTTFYVTGGAAVARIDAEWCDDTTMMVFRDNNTRWGVVGGAGAEVLAGPNWSVGAEALFLHFPESRNSFDNLGDTIELGQSDSAWVVRVLLNYRLGDLFAICRGY